MTQAPASFVIGFLIAGFVGWFSTLILKSWSVIERTEKKMFENPPQPALKRLPGGQNVSGIGVTPDEAPLSILFYGCITIFAQILLLLSFFSITGTIFWFAPKEDIPSSFFGGILSAAVFAFLLGNIRSSFKRIIVIYIMMIGPPSAILKFLNPPNTHNLAAVPPFPPFTVVFNGLVEIGLRLIWIALLFYLSYLYFSIVYFYLTEGEILLSPTGVFDL